MRRVISVEGEPRRCSQDRLRSSPSPPCSVRFPGVGTFVRMPLRRGTSRPWVGTVVNRDTGQPIDLREEGTSIRLTAREREGADPLIEKTYGVEDGPGGISVSSDSPGNVYSVDWEPEDTAELEAELLDFSVLVVEPDDEADEPVHGYIALSSS